MSSPLGPKSLFDLRSGAADLRRVLSGSESSCDDSAATPAEVVGRTCWIVVLAGLDPFCSTVWVRLESGCAGVDPAPVPLTGWTGSLLTVCLEFIAADVPFIRFIEAVEFCGCCELGAVAEV